MQIKFSNELVDYQEALKLMEERVEKIIAEQEEDLIWFLQHKAVYTAGTGAVESDLLEPAKFPVYNVGRGGKYTYHGPGQRIVYLMLNLKNHYKEPDLKKYVSDLEQIVIDSLKDFGVTSHRREGMIGIWVDKPKIEKIAAIGIRVRKWVAFHGVSINLNPDLSHFGGIVPCGISEFGVTSLEKLGVKFTIEEFDKKLLENIKKRFFVSS
jgi:lipoyl(octanoyl) transferase